MKHARQCYTIPAGKSFVNALADWLLAQYGRSEEELSTVLVLLPNRRSCRSLRDAFLARSGGKPLLLPRIQPIGDGDEEFTAAHYGAAEGLVKPAIPVLSRHLLLTRLVHAFQSRKTEQGKGRGYNLEQSARLARQLARLLDDVSRENLTLDKLADLVEGELAIHWQETLEFLTILSQEWPRILEAEGFTDVAAHRNRLLLAMVDIWKRKPPSHPVIAAGSTGSQPAITALLSAIASMPRGHVILPALDQAMPAAEWDILGETHPQYALKQLLNNIGTAREDVEELKGSAIDVAPERIECLRAMLLPPAATMKWQTMSLPLEKGFSHVQLLHAATQFDEARMIAIALRAALETQGKTAALITPDRSLARMVAAQMQRFNIAIDDSAGKPLNDTPPAAFLRLATAIDRKSVV
jgi:ATP-dependent helicase/nuclease subunit B